MTSKPRRSELETVLRMVTEEAVAYLRTVDARPVLSPRLHEALGSFHEKLPERGVGAAEALRQLIAGGSDAAAATSGPRCFHFVIGGVTPAALGADLLTSVLDQPAYVWVSSPLGVELEMICLAWLRDLFGLPQSWGGVMTTGATMANFVGLASAREWVGERSGVDIGEAGLSGLPSVPVFSSGYVHASAIKVLGLLGMGRSSVRRLTRDSVGRLDIEALERALEELDGGPAILIGNAGEVNAGDFDPIAQMADLAEAYSAWLHVDGAFGLFARLSPRTAKLVEGVERADSVTVDGHKWLNVPYDCGFAFVRDPAVMGRAFRYTAAYLPDPEDPKPNMGSIGPESSRRARALAVWATLRAYGRAGYRELVDGHLDLAQHLARRIDDAPELERLAEVPLNIVCFRCNPGDRPESELSVLNRRLADAILVDGRVYAGATEYEGRVALRPAIVNWRTRVEDVDHFVDVVRGLASKLR